MCTLIGTCPNCCKETICIPTDFNITIFYRALNYFHERVLRTNQVQLYLCKECDRLSTLNCLILSRDNRVSDGLKILTEKDFWLNVRTINPETDIPI